jgi:alpha-glucosidase
LRDGKTRFLAAGEPILAFQRGEGEGSILCVFNLSPVTRVVMVEGVSAPVGPGQHASLAEGRLTLGPNGVAFLPVTGTVSLQD